MTIKEVLQGSFCGIEYLGPKGLKRAKRLAGREAMASRSQWPDSLAAREALLAEGYQSWYHRSPDSLTWSMK